MLTATHAHPCWSASLRQSRLCQASRSPSAGMRLILGFGFLCSALTVACKNTTAGLGELQVCHTPALSSSSLSTSGTVHDNACLKVSSFRLDLSSLVEMAFYLPHLPLPQAPDCSLCLVVFVAVSMACDDFVCSLLLLQSHPRSPRQCLSLSLGCSPGWMPWVIMGD